MKLQDFITKLGKDGAAKPISIRYRRSVKTKKNYTGLPLYKESTIQAFVDFNYENSVNLQRNRENKSPNFRATSNWGKHESRAIITLGDKKYLQYKLQKVLDSKIYQGNREIKLSDVEEFLMSTELNKTTSKRQELNKPVILNRLNVENILSITADKHFYSK